MKPIIVIKIGSQILMDENKKFDISVIQTLARNIAEIRKKGYQCLIVSSGACALGKQVLGSTDGSILNNQITASVGQPILMKTYQDIFSYYDITVSQALLTRLDFANKTSYDSIQHVLLAQLKLGIIPIINENDVVASDEIVFSDNDQLAAFVAIMLKASKLIILSNTHGLCDKHPDDGGETIHNVATIDESVFCYVTEKKSQFGRGGMYSKLISAQAATSSGIDVILAYGREQNILTKIIQGEKTGTFFHKLPLTKKVNRVKSWIQAGALPKGVLTVNECLADILRQKKRVSILEIGVIGAQGDFVKDDLIEIRDSENNLLGKGLAKISKQEFDEYTISEQSRIMIHANYCVLGNT